MRSQHMSRSQHVLMLKGSSVSTNSVTQRLQQRWNLSSRLAECGSIASLPTQKTTLCLSRWAPLSRAVWRVSKPILYMKGHGHVSIAGQCLSHPIEVRYKKYATGSAARRTILQQNKNINYTQTGLQGDNSNYTQTALQYNSNSMQTVLQWHNKIDTQTAHIGKAFRVQRRKDCLEGSSMEHDSMEDDIYPPKKKKGSTSDSLTAIMH